VPRCRIHLPPQKFLFAQQLPPVFESRFVQSSRAQSGLHCASRFIFVRAIAKPAFRGQRVNIRKGLRDALRCIPELQLAQTWRVY